MSWNLSAMAAFDIESDGKDPKDARIITADLIICGVGVEPVRKSWVVKPERPIPAEAAAIHGYSTERAEAEGADRRTAIGQIQYEVVTALKAYPLVAFNAAYDLTLLAAECDRLGLPEHPRDQWRPVIDPYVIDLHADKYRPGKRRLGDVFAHYYPGKALENAHTSDADALCAARIAYKLGVAFPAIGAMSLDELYEAQIAWKAEKDADYQSYRRNVVGEKDFVADRGWPLYDVATAVAS